MALRRAKHVNEKYMKHYKECLFVPVPGNAVSFDLDYGGKNVICHGEYVDAAYIETETGGWQILGMARGIEWEGVTEKSEKILILTK